MNVKPKRTQVTTHDMAGDLFIQYISKKKIPKIGNRWIEREAIFTEAMATFWQTQQR